MLTRLYWHISASNSMQFHRFVYQSEDYVHILLLKIKKKYFNNHPFHEASYLCQIKLSSISSVDTATLMFSGQ